MCTGTCTLHASNVSVFSQAVNLFLVRFCVCIFSTFCFLLMKKTKQKTAAAALVVHLLCLLLYVLQFSSNLCTLTCVCADTSCLCTELGTGLFSGCAAQYNARAFMYHSNFVIQIQELTHSFFFF